MNDTEDDTQDAFKRADYIPEYINEKRRAFEDQFGLRMYLGSEVFASNFDYRLSIDTYWPDVESTIDTLSEVFSRYPDDFFEQLKTGDIHELGIYLCGGFTKINDYSADDAIALACNFGYERALAIDMNYRYCLESTIVHEISHWIEKTIVAKQEFGFCTDFEEGLCALNPTDYTYKYSYVSGKTKWKYIYGYGDLEETYFCDEYSQTYPGEDLAREFEYLMYGDEYQSEFITAPHIQEKLAYYFGCIREAFDDSNWPEMTSWEQRLSEYTEVPEEIPDDLGEQQDGEGADENAVNTEEDAA